MKLILVTLAVVLVVYLAYAGIHFYMKVQASKKIINATQAYQKPSDDHSNAMLVLGDSTAVGVGAGSPDKSLAGLVSVYEGATSVENYSKSGAVTADLPGQIAQVKLSQYHLILIQIGGNDIIRFHDVQKTADQLAAAIKTLPKADKVVIISAGDVGGSPLFPFFLRPFYTHLHLQYHAAFAQVASSTGTTYVNLYMAPENRLIENDPGTYLAADSLHPSAAGYALWFKSIQSALPAPRT
jgi:lysophospholipase L1-like esterase